MFGTSTGTLPTKLFGRPHLLWCLPLYIQSIWTKPDPSLSASDTSSPTQAAEKKTTLKGKGK